MVKVTILFQKLLNIMFSPHSIMEFVNWAFRISVDFHWYFWDDCFNDPQEKKNGWIFKMKHFPRWVESWIQKHLNSWDFTWFIRANYRLRTSNPANLRRGCSYRRSVSKDWSFYDYGRTWARIYWDLSRLYNFAEIKWNKNKIETSCPAKTIILGRKRMTHGALLDLSYSILPLWVLLIELRVQRRSGPRFEAFRVEWKDGIEILIEIQMILIEIRWKNPSRGLLRLNLDSDR